MPKCQYIDAILAYTACWTVCRAVNPAVDRSQEKGIGSACMRRILRDAGAQGKAVTLRVLKIDTRGIAFYQRPGFPVGDERFDTRVGN